MVRKFVLILSLFVLLSIAISVTLLYLYKKLPRGYPVRNIDTGLNYASIQEAINAPETLNGHTIFIKTGTYYEHVVVNKSLSLIGENRHTTIIDGNGTGTVIDILYNTTTIVDVLANAVNISGFTIRNGGFHGIVLLGTANCTVDNITAFNSTSCISFINSHGHRISNSKFSNGTWGIFLFNSTENEIVSNEVSENLHAGIAMGGLEGSSRNLIANNTVSNNVKLGTNHYGHGFDIVGSDNKILHNNVSNNNNGIILDMAHRNKLEGNLILNNTYFGIRLYGDSGNNTFLGNTIQESGLAGLHMDFGTNNVFNHNNFVNNNPQVDLVSYGTVWDDGVEGNYWADYAGEDNDKDGIGDAAYMVYEHYRDNHPLMGKLSAFNAIEDVYVNVISNSTVEDFEYIESNSTIRMHVSNMTSTQAFGFCRICIPHDLINPYVGAISVLIDDGQTSVLSLNTTLYDNGTHRWLYLAYAHSTLEIVISQEYASSIMPVYVHRNIGIFTLFSFAIFCAFSYPASACLTIAVPGSVVSTVTTRLPASFVPSATKHIPA